MALNKYHYITLDTQHSPRIALQNIVDGETGNRIWVTLTNNGETVDLGEQSGGANIYRVVLRVDSDLGTRRQDSEVAGDGITLVHDDTGNNGKANIRLSPDTFTVGLNRCRLEIYSTTWASFDTKIISAEFPFTAAKSDDEEVNEWRRGSTPTHTFTAAGIDFSHSAVRVTYEQDGKVVVDKNEDNTSFNRGMGILTWQLTADDTLAMRVGEVNIQMSYTLNGVTDYSDIHKGKVLYSQGV